MISIKYKRIHPDAKIPSYAHEGDAGMDLYSVEDYVLKPGEKIIVKTGIATEMPEGYFGSIRDRSGLAARYAIHVLAGVIDCHYRGEIGVVIIFKKLINKVKDQEKNLVLKVGKLINF